MQLPLPFGAAPQGAGRRVRVGALDLPLVVVRHRRARRYIVRLGPDEVVRLTVPRGASVAGGLAFAARQAAWIQRERARLGERARPWTAGTTLRFRGEVVALEAADGGVRCGPERIPVDPDAPDLRPAVVAHLRGLAGRELPARALALAAAHGFEVARVSVRDQRSRWGACSPRGVITLNWRLVQMPPAVSDYVIRHELAHLRHADHSRRFWREVERLDPSWREAERWLRRHGREIL